jgi:tetrahydromethanopterin S-methyltransferase subunit A
MASQQKALDEARKQLQEAIFARKCHVCGCLHETIAALEGTEVGRSELGQLLAEAKRVERPKEYDCLGCAVCYPAVASNALSEVFPVVAEHLVACPTDAPTERRGWPPLPGDYHVLRYRAPVAVCTLNSDELAAHLAAHGPETIGIVGTLRTENLGIERIIRNVLTNPHLRFLVLCGQDTEEAVGHLPGQCLESLFANGLDESGRIRGARGKRPVLKNVTAEEVRAFVQQVEPVSAIGETRADVIWQRVADLASRNPGPFISPSAIRRIEAVQASEPNRLLSDPAGFFVIYPDGVRQRLVIEHYSNAGVLDTIVEGASPAAVYTEIIERKLLTRLDHAAYLGRELTRADHCMRTGAHYVQDRAPGEADFADATHCGCSSVACREGDEGEEPANPRGRQ